MKIENISKKNNEVNVTLSSEELVKICNALFAIRHDCKDNPIYHRLYSDMVIARDLSQYGQLNNCSIAKIVEQRGANVIKSELEMITEKKSESIMDLLD